MPGRSFNSNDYRYSVNGQEKTDEISGNGNHTTAMYWEYDTRLGRRWNIDPEFGKFPWQSPYCTFDDNPILKTDVLGLSTSTATPSPDKKKETTSAYPLEPYGVFATQGSNTTTLFGVTVLNSPEFKLKSANKIVTGKSTGTIKMSAGDKPVIFENKGTFTGMAATNAMNQVQASGGEVTTSKVDDLTAANTAAGWAFFAVITAVDTESTIKEASDKSTNEKASVWINYGYRTALNAAGTYNPYIGGVLMTKGAMEAQHQANKTYVDIKKKEGKTYMTDTYSDVGFGYW